MKRTFFGIVWSFVFIFVTVVTMALVAVQSAGGNEAKQQQAAKEAGEKYGGLGILGAIGAAIVLSVAGVLPGTRKRDPAQPGASAPAQPGAGTPATQFLTQTSPRPMITSRSQLAPSEHGFYLIGFFSRYHQIMGGIPLFIFLTLLSASVSNQDPKAAQIGAVFFLIGLYIVLYLLYRFCAIRWVRLDADGVSWRGLFGSGYRQWEEIRSVIREESILNRRYRTRRIKLLFNGWGSVTFDQSIADFDHLAATIQTVTGELLLPKKWEELQQKGKVGFGPVTLHKDGIKMQNKYFSWDSLGKYRIENGHLVVYARFRPRNGGDKGIPLREVPDYPVLLTLMRDSGAPL